MRNIVNNIAQKQNLMILLAGFFVVIYITGLLGFSYLSQSHLEAAARERFRLDAEKRAIAISYFFSERRNDFKELTQTNELLAYFKNQALGMSMQYGLQASLLAITDLFNGIVEEKKINQDRIYEWVVFVDKTGIILAGSKGAFATIKNAGPDLKNWLTIKNAGSFYHCLFL